MRYAIIFSLMIFITARCFATTEEDHELQERCVKTAADNFKSGYGLGNETSTEFAYRAKYSSHYNTQLKRCLVLTVIDSHMMFGDLKVVTINTTVLKDDNDEIYGGFVKFSIDDDVKDFHCQIQDTKCNSQDELEALISPFMNQ